MPQDPPSFTSAPRADSYTNPLEGVTFRLDGESFECKGEVSILDLSELAVMASQDAESPQAVGAMSAYMQVVLGPVEYLRFRGHTRMQHTDAGTILAIMNMINGKIQSLVEDLTGRPTEPPESSSDGLGETEGRISKVISLQRGDVQVIGPDDPVPPGVPDRAIKVSAAQARQRAGGGRRTGTKG